MIKIEENSSVKIDMKIIGNVNLKKKTIKRNILTKPLYFRTHVSKTHILPLLSKIYI